MFTILCGFFRGYFTAKLQQIFRLLLLLFSLVIGYCFWFSRAILIAVIFSFAKKCLCVCLTSLFFPLSVCIPITFRSLYIFGYVTCDGLCPVRLMMNVFFKCNSETVNSLLFILSLLILLLPEPAFIVSF